MCYLSSKCDEYQSYWGLSSVSWICLELALDFSDIGLLGNDLLDANIDLIETDIDSFLVNILFVTKTSGRHFQHISWRCLEDVFNVTIRHVLKTSWVHLPRRPEDVCTRRLENVLENKKLLRGRLVQDIFKACLNNLLKTFSIRLQDISRL